MFHSLYIRKLIKVGVVRTLQSIMFVAYYTHTLINKNKYLHDLSATLNDLSLLFRQEKDNG